MDYWYWFYWLNYLYIWIISLLLSVIQAVLLFKYFKNPIKYSNINIIFIILMLLLYLWLTMYKWLYLIVIIIYHLIFLFNFIQFRKFLNLEEWEEKNKHVKYTGKNQFKNIFILYWAVIFSLIIFYFSYYSVPVIDFKHINDNYFENIHKYKDIPNEENWYEQLIKYWEHREQMKYVENTDIKKYFGNDFKWIENIKFDKGRIKKLDSLRLWIDEIINRKAIIYDIEKDFFSLSWISMMSRETIYNVLYYLEEWDEEKAIRYLMDNYKLWNMLITSYWPLVNFIVWIVVQDTTNLELNYILDNYTLSDSTLKYIKKEIIKWTDMASAYKNAINYEYNNKLNIQKSNTELFNIKWSFIFSNDNYYNNGLKNQYFSYTNWEKNYCGKFKDYKLKLFLKKDALSNIMLRIGCINLDWYNENLKKRIKIERELLDRVEKILN